MIRPGRLGFSSRRQAFARKSCLNTGLGRDDDPDVIALSCGLNSEVVIAGARQTYLKRSFRSTAPGKSLMMMLLLMAGVGAFLGGVVAILFGIPVKEFSFGNTLIVVGAMAACTGLIMIALSVVVGELKTIARRVGARAVAEDRERSALAPIVPESDEDDFLFARDQSVRQDESDREPAMPPPRNGANASRARQEVQPEPEPFEPTPKARRNMMFASASRKERERAARPADIPPPPIPEASELPPLSFGASWPKPERMRPPDAPLQR